MPSSVTAVCDSSWPLREIVCAASGSFVAWVTSTPAILLSASVSESETLRTALSVSTSRVVTETRALTRPMTLRPLASVLADVAGGAPAGTCAPRFTSTSTSLLPNISNCGETFPMNPFLTTRTR